MTKQNIFKRIFGWFMKHKIWSVIILLLIVGGGYWSYGKIFPTVTIPQYTLSTARLGSIIQTVTGTGQVSASNQTDIQSQVSGTIKTINVSVGQSVHTGDLIATIDSTNAAISLASAKLSLEKLTQPAKITDISNTQSNLIKSYDSGFNTVAGIFLDLPNVLSGMKNLLYGQSGFLSNQGSSYLNTTGQSYRDTAGKSYDAAVSQYQKVLLEYSDTTRASATSSIDALIADTYTTIKDVAQAATDAQNAINYIVTTQPDYQKTLATSALANITTWSNQANTDVSNIVATQNSILSANNSLTTLLAGSDTLDIQSAELSLEQAQKTYDNYFIRAPYDGVIGRIPVNVFGQAGSATAIATIIGQQKMASISLNEVDAAKVKVGQTVNITFDAIDNFNATGTVSVVDQIGTVSSGVVSYGVKILINTSDARIKPGMSVNTTIVTLQKDGVLIIPSAAIKKTGNQSSVQTFDPAIVKSSVAAATAAAGTVSNSAATTSNTPGNYTRNRGVGSTTPMDLASTTAGVTFGTTTGNIAASSTRSFGNYSGSNSASRSIIISTVTAPTKVTISVGDSDDTNTEVTSGLTRGAFVVTKVTTTSGTQSTTAPSILSSLGAGGRGVGGGGARPTGATAGAARPAGN